MADSDDMPKVDVSFDVKDPVAMRDLFNEAASLNLSSPLRRGSVIELPDTGRALLTGDLHDAPGHFDKLLKLSRIAYTENYHLVLQETIHGDHLINHMDFSYRGLAKIAEQKILRPDQIHHVQSNHELAQLRGEGILKESVSVVEAFHDGLDYVFGEDAEKVNEAINRYIASLPLAVRTTTGILCAHSLPNANKMRLFDPAVLDRRPTEQDLAGPDGSAYIMVWGRNYTQQTTDQLAKAWGVDLFILGHQHVEMGWDILGTRVIILNTDHNHAHALPIDLARKYSQTDLMDEVLPLAAVL